MTIWKYELPLKLIAGGAAIWDSSCTLDMPAGARPLSVGLQYDCAALWALVDEHAAKAPQTFAIVATGKPAPEDGEFVGTVLMADAGLVFHVFKVRP